MAWAGFEKVARHEGPVEIKHRLLMPDGRIKHVHMVASPLFTRQGRVEYLGAVRDVTACKQAEEALFRLQCELAHVTRMTSLGELAASIAHEVNQPLTAITSSGEACRRWLDRPAPDLAEARQALGLIIANANRASEVINRIRSLSRKCDPVRQSESLNEIVSETLLLVQREIELHAITLDLELADSPRRISADRVQLQQVIINLIINACQAMQSTPVPDRVLRVVTKVTDEEWLLEVTDQGAGLAPKVLPRLFNPFFTTKENGLGMGLCICRSIIDFHGGRIWAAPVSGPGASFRFALPVLS